MSDLSLERARELNRRGDDAPAGLIRSGCAMVLVDDMADEIDRLRAALAKVDAIRNSIVGAQAVNWSEHVYPLVAALEEAGYKGQPYESARANIGTLIDRNEKLEAAVRTLGKCRRCNGDGEYLPTCFRCDDSTDDHECPGPRACTDCEQTGLAKAAREVLAPSPIVEEGETKR